MNITDFESFEDFTNDDHSILDTFQCISKYDKEVSKEIIEKIVTKIIYESNAQRESIKKEARGLYDKANALYTDNKIGEFITSEKFMMVSHIEDVCKKNLITDEFDCDKLIESIINVKKNFIEMRRKNDSKKYYDIIDEIQSLKKRAKKLYTDFEKNDYSDHVLELYDKLRSE